MVAPDIGPRLESLRYGALIVLLGACFVFGGASRNDVPALILLQPIAVICGAVFILTAPAIRWETVRVPLLLLMALTAVIAVQLVPLPPSIWTQLPGHSNLAASAQFAGIEQPWRPISLTPDLTLSSLAGVVVPLAVLLGLGSVSSERVQRLLPLLVVACVFSAILGLVQIGGGANSPFYLYRVTSEHLPVGLLANRNHQAVLLAMVLPMLGLWASLSAERRAYLSRRWIAATLSLFLLLMIIATGSRAGLLVGLVGLAAALLFWRRRDSAAPHRDQLNRPLFFASLAAGVIVIGSAILLSRDEALKRALGLSLGEDLRFQYLPTLLKVAGDFFPVGSGFGSYDPVYRMYEPFELLQPKYLNHAHNDLIELVIVGGLPAILVLIAFLVWVGQRAPSLIRSFPHSIAAAFGCLGLVMVLLLMGSSLVDYPLRTPLHAALLAVALGWIAEPLQSSRLSTASPGERKSFTGKVPLHSDARLMRNR